jgi:hypothetical protein
MELFEGFNFKCPYCDTVSEYRPEEIRNDTLVIKMLTDRERTEPRDYVVKCKNEKCGKTFKVTI